MLTLIFGCFFGLAIGFIFSILPGFSSLNATMAATLVGIINPACVPAAIFTSLVTSIFLSAGKESINPALSANPTLVACSPVDSGVNTVNATFSAKVLGAFLGLLIGLIVTSQGIVMGTAPITWLVALFMTWMLVISFNKHTWIVIGYLLLSQLFFYLAGVFNIANPIFLLGSAIFVIPSLLGAQQKEELTKEEKYESPDATKTILGLALSLCTPGISSGLAVMGTSKKSTVLTQLSSQVCETATEAFALVGLSNGIASGKALLGLEVGLSGFAPWMCLVFVGLIFVCWFLLPIASAIFSNISSLPGINLVSAVMVVATCTILSGLLGICVCALGLLTVMILRAVGAPQTILSLTFLGPILL